MTEEQALDAARRFYLAQSGSDEWVPQFDMGAFRPESDPTTWIVYVHFVHRNGGGLDAHATVIVDDATGAARFPDPVTGV